MDLIRLVKEDMREQQYLLQVYKQALAKLPEGRLHYRLVDGTVRYFTLDLETRKEVYIRKREQNKVYQLKYRRFLEEAIKTIEQNLKSQDVL